MNTVLRCVLTLAVLMAAMWPLASPTADQATAEPSVADDSTPSLVIEVALVGPIGPATTDFFRTALKQAEDRHAAALILRLDTPGGLAEATRDIDQAVLAAKVPVIAWVAPAGARAASAGTYILYASHLAAMAPGTHVGAATPVALGGPVAPGRPAGTPADAPRQEPAEADRANENKPASGQPSDSSDLPNPSSTLERKMINDSAAHLRALAELRGRSVEWAERAVRGAESLTADEALQQGVIELLADSRESLLTQAHGRSVQLAGEPHRLHTRSAVVEQIDPDWRTELLSLITNPSVAYVLLLVGLYGLLLEGYHPGAMVPGVVGVLCLLLAAYALQVLPVNYAGLALIIVGVGLMLAELVTPSFGVLGIGGLAALVLGSVILFDTGVPGFSVSRGLIAAIAAASGAVMLSLLYLIARARKQPRSGGVDELQSASAQALEDFADEGWVQAWGETWRARSDLPVSKGQQLCVLAVDGLLLHVKAVSDPAAQGAQPSRAGHTG